MSEDFNLDPTLPPLALCFVHKRLIGAAIGLVTGGPGAAVSGFVRGGGSRRFTGADRGASLGGRDCPPGTELNRRGNCAVLAGLPGLGGAELPQRFQPTERAFRPETAVATRGGTMQDRGVAVGPGMHFANPEVVPSTRLQCPRFMVLGWDDLCYEKGGKFGISNSRRKWPRGTRPFLTGGEVACMVRADKLKNSKRNKKLFKQLGLGGR